MEISEILFNELAFFRLMQDLDNNSSVALAKHKNKKRAEQPSKAKPSVKVSSSTPFLNFFWSISTLYFKEMVE